ncbi:hypothetical protein PG994_006889 [Apiospora phragmitis]|uniref:Amidoligase enzyme n=1 Tax=Apiospora phragmitis TaxID=2905665 RepID=A0ABR1VGA1_9PEZI
MQITPPKPPRPTMTHGKEVEFLVRYVHQLAITGTDPEEGLCRMQEANPGVVVVPLTQDEDDVVPEDYTKTLKMNGVDINPLANAHWISPADYHRWTIDEDITVRSTPEERQQDVPAPGQRQFGWYGLELISPANPNTPASHQEMTFVLGVLRQKYGDRMRVNNRCGLHVHVGMGPDAIPVAQLRRIAALLYAADPVLASHPAAGRGRGAAGVHHGLRRVPATTVPRRQGQLQLQQLSRAAAAPGYVTVEFRQHEGTLDPARIEAWARLCVGLTEWAAFNMTDDQLARVVTATEWVEQRQSQNPQPQQQGLVDLLRRDALRHLLELAGLGEFVPFYGLQRQQ